MTDQSLRAALEKLAADLSKPIQESYGYPEGNAYVDGKSTANESTADEIRDLLAAHPAEPAPSDYSREEIAAKIADRVPHSDMDGFTLGERLKIGAAVAPLFTALLKGAES